MQYNCVSKTPHIATGVTVRNISCVIAWYLPNGGSLGQRTRDSSNSNALATPTDNGEGSNRVDRISRSGR